MQLITIVEDYCCALAKRAIAEPAPGGGVQAIVPEVPGVVASGDSIRDCWLDLLSRLEDWVAVAIERGWNLPIVDDIDLNSEEGRRLARYHDLTVPATGPDFFGRV